METIGLPVPPQRQRAYAAIVTVLFCVALVLPLGAWAVGLKWNEIADEKRTAATRPPMPQSFEDAVAYPSRVNAWFNDRFPFRKPLVEINASWTMMLAESPNNSVIIGHNKWLYARDGTDALVRSVNVSPEAIKTFDAMVRERAAWLKSRGMTYLFVIVPDKHEIYPENLPFIMSVQRGARASYVQQLLAGISEEARAHVLYLGPALQAERNVHGLFKLSDTHWNFYGALAGQKGIVERLRADYPALQPQTPADYTFTKYKESGDLSMFISQKERFEEELEMGAPREKRASLVSPELPWTPFRVFDYARPGTALPRLFIHGDSFLEMLHPILADAFSAAHCEVNTGEKKTESEFITAEILKFKPNIVINETIERQLWMQVLENSAEVKGALPTH